MSKERKSQLEFEKTPDYQPVVSVVPIKYGRPDEVFIPNIADVNFIWLSRVDFIKKNLKAKNPFEIMPIHGRMNPDDNPYTVAIDELRQEFQCPEFPIAYEQAFVRRYSATLSEELTIHREEHMIAIYGQRIVDPIGANPVDKIAYPISLTPQEIDDLFINNQYDDETPLLTSLYHDPSEKNPLHPSVEANPEETLAAREYIADTAYWFEFGARIRTISEVLRRDNEYLQSLDGDEIDRIMYLLTLSDNTLYDARAFLEEVQASTGSNARAAVLPWSGDPRDLMKEIAGFIAKLSKAQVGDGFYNDYRAAYADMYFTDILSIPSDDTQKPLLDAVAILSSETITPEMLEQLEESNPYLYRLVSQLAETLDIPIYRDPHFFYDMQSRVEQLLAQPYELELAGKKLKERLFGSEENFMQYQDDAIQIVEDMSAVFLPLYPNEAAFAADFDISHLQDENPIILFAQAFRLGTTDQSLDMSERFQSLRHLILMLYTQELYPIYAELRSRRPQIGQTISRILRDTGGNVHYFDEYIPVRSISKPKEFPSFARKVLERTPPRQVFDVNRLTLTAGTNDPRKGLAAVMSVAEDAIEYHVDQGHTVAISNIKMHPAMLPYLERMQEKFEGSLQVDSNHTGSLATSKAMRDVYWGKMVITVDGIPMEIALTARELDVQAKIQDDEDFQLRRLFVTGQNRLSLVDAMFSLQPLLRERLLTYYYNRGVTTFKQ